MFQTFCSRLCKLSDEHKVCFGLFVVVCFIVEHLKSECLSDIKGVLLFQQWPTECCLELYYLDMLMSVGLIQTLSGCSNTKPTDSDNVMLIERTACVKRAKICE